MVDPISLNRIIHERNKMIDPSLLSPEIKANLLQGRYKKMFEKVYPDFYKNL